jgi:hypothetical protein
MTIRCRVPRNQRQTPARIKLIQFVHEGSKILHILFDSYQIAKLFESPNWFTVGHDLLVATARATSCYSETHK